MRYLFVNFKYLLSLCIILLITILTFNHSYANSRPRVTYSLKSSTIKELVKIIDPSTLVLINIDNTIVMPKSKMFRYNNTPHRFFVENLKSAATTTPSLNKRVALILERRKLMLVEPEWSDFIEQLKDTGAMILGFYHTEIPEYGMIANLEELRYQQLKELNINFTDKIYGKESFILGQKSSKASFYKGILFSGFLNSSESIIEFMKATHIVPSKIILFEQNMNYIEQVRNGLQAFDLEYHPVQYFAERDIIAEPDEKVIKFQQDTLISNLQWLEDEEAEELLKAKEASATP